MKITFDTDNYADMVIASNIINGLIDKTDKERIIVDCEILSFRPCKALNDADINTISDILAAGERELMKIDNIGQTSITEIKMMLSDNGLNLKY